MFLQAVREEADGRKEAEEGSGEEVRTSNSIQTFVCQLFQELVILREY